MKKVAIIGAGPRGLYAFENLYSSYAKLSPIVDFHVTIYEKSETLGTGSAWAIDQAETNWTNIAQRALVDLHGRSQISFKNLAVPAFPKYLEWLPKDARHKSIDEPDRFPPRSTVGNYFVERFATIADVLIQEGLLTVYHSQVETIEQAENKFVVSDSQKNNEYFDEVLFAIGHQSTEDSSQLQEWENFEKRANCTLFKHPYPISQYSFDKVNEQGTNVAVRGFGLSAIDLCRAFAEIDGGRFELTDPQTHQMKYVPGSDLNLTIVPFTLEGLTCVPKPLNGAVDRAFTPSESQLDTFRSKLRSATENHQSINDIHFFVDAITNLSADIFVNLGELSYSHDYGVDVVSDKIKQWVLDKTYHDELLLDTRNTPLSQMIEYVGMATATLPVSLDYCVGQVWRHCQPTIYKELSHTQIHDDIISEIVRLDEESKRYSFGPPVDSIQQLIALANEGMLNLSYLHDPDIELTQNGWRLSFDSNTINCTVMINSVLAPPSILETDTTLVKKLLEDEMLKPIHSKLGVTTNTYGSVESQSGETLHHLTMLGRLCKGSVIGVDAILECFGTRIIDWAEAAARRLYSI